MSAPRRRGTIRAAAVLASVLCLPGGRASAQACPPNFRVAGTVGPAGAIVLGAWDFDRDGRMDLLLRADGEVRVARSEGKLGNLTEKIASSPPPGRFGIGHPRWATHGRPTEENAHPHRDASGRIVVIHNGIIENFLPLKQGLQRAGVHFLSETDTEVVAHALAAARNAAPAKPFAEVVRETAAGLKGMYALVLFSADEPGVLYALKWGPPIVLGVGIGVLAQPQLVVRFMTAKDNRSLNRAVLIGGIFILMMTGVAFTVGALTNVYFYQHTGQIAIDAAGGNVDSIMPIFIPAPAPLCPSGNRFHASGTLCSGSAWFNSGCTLRTVCSLTAPGISSSSAARASGMLTISPLKTVSRLSMTVPPWAATAVRAGACNCRTGCAAPPSPPPNPSATGPSGSRLTKIISTSQRHPSRSLPRSIRPSRATSLNSIQATTRKKPSRKANSQWPWPNPPGATACGKGDYRLLASSLIGDRSRDSRIRA